VRRAIYGQRFPRFHSDEGARFININGITISHHKRGSGLKCPLCWDDYSGRPSPNCTNCIDGYLEDIRKKRGYIATIQPYGNFGVGLQSFKSGGQHVRIAAYIYMDFLNGRGVEFGDRLVYDQKGFKQEVTVMNKQPQMTSGGEISMFVFECASPMDKDVTPVVV
jgi:hypothetical protein